MANFLVEAQWLYEHLQDDNLVIVDCQWDENAYIKAHIPGAIMRPKHAYLKSEKEGTPTKYLPTEQEFAALLKQMGIDQDTQVVCYDEWGNHFATRFWWVAAYYGFHNVSLLDGGWQGWLAAGFPASFKTSKPRPQQKPFVASPNHLLKIEMKEVVENLGNPAWQILDVRSDDEFEGKNLAGNNRGGHIKEAIHLEWKNLLTHLNQPDEVNHFLSEEAMLTKLDAAGVSKEKTIVVHCQSGVRASFMAFCLTKLGYPKVRLYDGSMSEWANEIHTPLVK